MSDQRPDEHVIRLEEARRDDVDLVGAKGANLGELAGAGLPVAEGVIVTTAVYRRLTEDPGISETITRLDGLDETDEQLLTVAAQLREAIADRGIGEAFERELTATLDTERNVDGAAETTYAVRSSATAEDLPTASFAGQHETFLGVSASAVPARVRDCLASLFTDRAVTYRVRAGIATTDVEMAVVVQEMVDAEAAGVLFTADPETGNRTVALVEATYGLGEGLVSGAVSPDRARVDRRTGASVEYEVGEKATTWRVRDTDMGTTETSADRRAKRVLSDVQIGTLLELGDRIEEVFGVSQDIEWALVDGDFVISQSRPITSLPTLPEPRPEDERLHVYFSMGHAQAMTAPMPPLALDLWATMYSNLLNAFTDGDYDWVARSDGRAYLDITPFLGPGVVRDGVVQTLAEVDEAAAVGTAELLERRSDEFETKLSVRGVIRAGWSALTLPPAVVRLLPGMVREGVLPFLRGGEGTEQYKRWFHTWGELLETRVLGAANPEQLVENAFEGILVESVFEITPKSLRILVGPVTGGLLERLVPEADAELLAAVARGAEQEVGTRMTLALSDMADTARAEPEVAAAVRDGQSLDDFRSVEGSEPFLAEFEAFLDEFGHRAVGEFDPSRPRWRDDPSVPLGLVRARLDTEEPGAHRERLRDRQQQAWAATETLLASAGQGLLGPVRRPLVARLVRTYRAHVPLRDEPKHGSAHLFAAWHEAIQQTGRHLVAEEVLSDADDVWFLHRAELERLLDAPNSVLPDIEGRKRAHERYARIDAPAVITSEGEIPLVRQGDESPTTLVGTGVSPGVIEGRVRIVHDPSGVSLDPGDILVCPFSDPAWTPLFSVASGLVTEVGGRLTHGSLVAREYGLPAVVSVRNATTRLHEGQRIRVDGTEGTVDILDS